MHVKLIMQTKLTLRLEDELIKKAKIKAKEQGKSLSQIVADYFKLLAQDSRMPPVLSLTTASLVGIINEVDLDESNYKKHLEDKYL